MNTEDILKDYSIDYESGSSNSYIVIRNKDNVLCKNYQVEMINYNSIVGLLSLDIRQKNSITGLYYNITSKITLSQYIAHKKLNKDEFISILSNIVRTLLNCRKYLLSDNSFILNEDYIFINPSSQDTFLVYLPVEQKCNLADSLRSFIIRIIVEKANFDESSNDNFLQKVLEFVRNDNLTIQSFNLFLNELKNEPEKVGQINPIPADKVQSDKVTKPEINSETQITFKPKTKKEQAYSFCIPNVIGKNSVPKKNCDRNSNQSAPKKNKSNQVILAVLVQALVVTLFFIGKGYLLTITGDIISAYAGTGITLLSIDFLAMRKIFDIKEEKAKQVNISKKTIVSDSNMEIHGINRKDQEQKSRKEDILDLNIHSIQTEEGNTRDNARDNTISHEMVSLEDTTVLCEKESDIPYLSYKHDGIEERVDVSKNSFIIGRLQGHADYITSNNAVGKVHAEILIKENKYFLKDLNSRNGSFINGEQVIPNRENQIKSGDRISLANSEFVFFAPVNSNG